jgi:hypothetical protein
VTATCHAWKSCRRERRWACSAGLVATAMPRVYASAASEVRPLGGADRQGGVEPVVAVQLQIIDDRETGPWAVHLGHGDSPFRATTGVGVTAHSWA